MKKECSPFLLVTGFRMDEYNVSNEKPRLSTALLEWGDMSISRALRISAFLLIFVSSHSTESSSFKTISTTAENEEEKTHFVLTAGHILPFEFPTYNPPQWADELVSTTMRVEITKTLFKNGALFSFILDWTEGFLWLQTCINKAIKSNFVCTK